jgi:hypothetical protein
LAEPLYRRSISTFTAPKISTGEKRSRFALEMARWDSNRQPQNEFEEKTERRTDCVASPQRNRTALPLSYSGTEEPLAGFEPATCRLSTK